MLVNTKIEDLDQIIAMETHSDNSAFVFPNSREEHLDLISNNDINHFVLKEANGSLIGYVILAGLTNANKSIELRRIVISKKGKGYGRKTLKKIKDYCFSELQCHRLWLDVLEVNERARYLYQTEGFKEEGILRDSIFKDGEYQNLIIMSMLESEYRNQKK
ncbi:GNAT family protein [Pontimicrobium sp. SW4]|uniref:GNAT family protein n=1 Tax=Pontimicrobium sp. SW4 TaxID=3153519 RepID=A0AAU7BPB5_9FLAO